jgi:serine/threonine protein kinase/tetratricopeptide (TPR) repeat protein
MPENWDQVKQILELALDRKPEERSGFIRQACGEDVALRAEVESLLLHLTNADTLLENSPVADLLSFAPDTMAGKRIGAYRIIRELGRGGMAVVYLGERDDQSYRKQVAIKMVKSGIDTEQVLHRFRNERQTLASLNHSNIVKLLDGGSGEDGSPYLVMEYVDGLPIDRYCDLNKLSIGDRLRLFREVCSAVQYAHENLVIHRDLKPGNILIAKGGIPRLLDFGIAKLLNPECLQTPLITRTNWRPMTLEYASPEQIRGLAITTATDVYSLGVLLFELLTGHRPYRTAGQSLLEMERLVCEEEPERPSAVIDRKKEKATRDGNAQTSATSEWVSNQRGLQPAELQRRLRGDLDTIVMKALSKEPERRYGSVEEFSRDLERHLTGVPVKARKSTIAYRSGRFLKRHRESLAAALVVLGIVAGIATWEVHSVSRQNAAVPQAKSTQVQGRRSVAVLGFKNLSDRPETAWVSTALSEVLTAELAAGEQLRTVPDETVARTKIDLGLSEVESLTSDTLKQVRKNLASDFIILGSYLDLGKEKGGQIRLDLRLVDAVKGETTAAVSETGTEKTIVDLVSQVGARLREQFGLQKLSKIESDGVRAELPSNPEAMRPYSQGLAKLRAFDALSARELFSHAVTADPSSPLAHSELARTWSSLGYDSNAEQEARKALEGAGNLSREKHLLVEARFYETSRDWGKAIEAYQTLCSFFPDNLEYGLQLANAETAGGRGKDALRSLAALDALGAQRKDDPRIDLARSDAAASLGDDKLRRDTAELAAQEAGNQGAKLLVARARNSECRALADLGENEKATSACEEARQIYEAAGDRSGLAQTLHDMAEVPINQGDFAAAEKLYSQALSIARAIGNQKGQAKELLDLGVISVKRGDLATARRTYDEAFRIYQRVGDKYGMASVMGDTGILLRVQGKLQDALKHFQKTFELSNEVGHRRSAAMALSAIGDVLLEEGSLPEAYKMYQQASTIEHEIGAKNIYASTLTQIGRVFRQQAKADEAQKAYDESLSLEEELGNKSDAADTRLALAELDCDSGKGAEAEQLSRAAVQAFRADAYADEEIFAQSMLSRALLQQGKVDEAHAAIAEAVRLSEKSQNVTVRIPMILNHAYVMAAEKNLGGAETSAQEALAQARKLGLFRLQLEASLALGEVQMQRKNPDMGRKRLEETAQAARSKGFELIARRAIAARHATHPLNTTG